MTFTIHLKDGTVVGSSGDRLVYTADPRILAVMNGPSQVLIVLADDFEYCVVSQ